jgi:aspartate/methionine/tyrosine aminotransferase
MGFWLRNPCGVSSFSNAFGSDFTDYISCCTGSFQISAVVRNNVKIIPVHITLEESKSAQAVVAAYRSASQSAASRIRGILFCNPHNPSGHIARPEVIDLLLQYCEEADIHFISDEIYALSTFETPDDLLNASRKIFQSPAKSFVSVLHRDLGGLGVCPSRVHQVYSISKDLGCSGLRLVRSKSRTTRNASG